MALSLIVLLIPVFLIVGAYRFLYGGDTIVTVDPTETIASAQRAGMDHLPPAGAPEGWLIVTAQFRDGVLRIGYLDQEKRGVQLVQSRTDLATTERAKPGETRLVGRSGDVTVVLLGKGADLGPLAKLLPIPVSESGSAK
ncbi:MAG TPA: hypothetical protein DGT23_31185 [Micromonosporaceae bacterium]|nr:hypothetical protein [Micromonosporaceae bacterium]